MIFERIEETCRRWNSKGKEKLLSLCPPGYDLTGEYRVFWGWLLVSMGYSFKYLLQYSDAYENLFYRTGEGMVLNTSMRMPLFHTLLEDSLYGFLLGILFLILVFAGHYSYYRKESKSIYIMKRLKNRNLLWKTYLGTPIVYGMVFLVAGLVLLAIYYGIYRLVTPVECMTVLY